jgi:hypothetical protein
MEFTTFLACRHFNGPVLRLMRGMAADDAWHEISNRMDAILLKVDEWELSKFKAMP